MSQIEIPGHQIAEVGPGKNMFASVLWFRTLFYTDI
jgi:hypothetical protein